MASNALTFLFTDIEGSTQRWERARDAMMTALARHDALMRAAIAARNGSVFKTAGDAFCAAFASAPEAAAAAIDAQRSLLAENFSDVDGLRLRMALCSGTAEQRDGDYFGPAVNRVARLLASAAGGQVLISQSSAELLKSSGIALRDLGEHRLKGLDEAERIFQLLADGLPSDFPPLRSMDAEEIRPTPGFAGRDAEMAALAAALDRTDAVAAIHGLGGTGKSSLAREYARRNRDRYAVTWWLHAQSESGIVDGLLRLGALFIKGLDQLADRYAAAQQVIRGALSDFSKPVLLIFDNLEDERLLRTWRPLAGSRVVVTSRNAAWDADVTAIALHTWELEIAIQYLQRESGRADLTGADARAIAEALGSLPLALSHAAASLRGMRMVTPARYLERIGQHLRNAPRGAEYPQSVFATFITAIAQAEREAAGAAAILCFAASFAPDAIPDELFRQPAERYAALHPTMPEDASALDLHGAVSDDLRLDEALGALDRFSLSTYSEALHAYSIHRLVQLVAKDMVVEDELGWRECAVGVTDAIFPDGDFATWPQCERLLSHARAALDALAGDVVFLPAASLADRCSAYLRRRGEYGAAESLCARALAIREKTLGPDHPVVAQSLNNLAFLHYERGRYKEAEQLHTRALAIREKALGPDHLNVASSLNNLALLYYEQGLYEEAHRLHARALTICEKALGPDHPNVAHCLNNLADVYYEQGRYGEAEPLHARALAIREKALGPNHPEVAQSLNNLAFLYYEQGRYGEAERLHRRALAIREKAFGPDHPEVAQSLNNLALLHDKQGRYAEAQPLHARALAIWEKAFGAEHPSVAGSLNDLANVYCAQGHFEEAEPLYIRALAIQEKALGPDHPDVATSLNDRAEMYDAQERYAEAEPLYLRALAIRERALGHDHALTKATREKSIVLRSK